MTAPKRTTRRPAKPKPAPCPDCTTGQVSEAFKVGARSKRESTDREEALCLTCFGTGHSPN
ncbi:hypothetical protein HRW16_23245 [Streptomyces lunaelactis]|uniref:hypothetical protein n=1 Tax=Streptomyces lunaelactis TaxID=1535768 RepID=UPI0015849CB2|nr:hypothetical protein [Streptomyces lunaelactis]NUK37319.1 hypothetical protein [Streptomyces lunaelactis]NUK43357.1 hypothetical protein [Streptomyces lunaelactis]NUK94695.1 hypothetical protein [Streptomyces lunaelactis]